MSYYEAAEILDMRKAGADMPEAVVNRALQLTGDMDSPYSVADAMREIQNESRFE